MKQDEGELLDDDDLDLFSGPQSQPAELDQTIDYNFAQQELMMNEYSNDPIQEAICDLEKQYEEDKQGKDRRTSTSTWGESRSNMLQNLCPSYPNCKSVHRKYVKIK